MFRKIKRKVYLLNFSNFIIDIGTALAGLVTCVLVGLEKFQEIVPVAIFYQDSVEFQDATSHWQQKLMFLEVSLLFVYNYL